MVAKAAPVVLALFTFSLSAVCSSASAVEWSILQDGGDNDAGEVPEETRGLAAIAEEKEWFPTYSAFYGQMSLNKCEEISNPIATLGGTKCEARPTKSDYMCLFGYQSCWTAKQLKHPTVRCDCRNGYWECQSFDSCSRRANPLIVAVNGGMTTVIRERDSIKEVRKRIKRTFRRRYQSRFKKFYAAVLEKYGAPASTNKPVSTGKPVHKSTKKTAAKRTKPPSRQPSRPPSKKPSKPATKPPSKQPTKRPSKRPTAKPTRPVTKASSLRPVASKKSFAYAKLGPYGKMVYKPFTRRGDRIPDFSYVGYKAGAEEIPTVSVRVTLYPDKSIRDDRQRIQAAIDRVSAMPLRSDGFRGTVLLKKGTYTLNVKPGQNWCLKIAASGVVLRGEGMWSKHGTVLHSISTKRESTLIVTDGTNGVGKSLLQTKNGKEVLDDYLPVNFRSFRVKGASKLYSVGDNIAVRRNTNRKWVEAIDADKIERRTSEASVKPYKVDYMGRNMYYKKNGKWIQRMPWKPQLRESYWRVITKIEGDRITVDVPIPEFFSKEYGGGFVFKMDTGGLLENVGFEKFRITTNFRKNKDGLNTRDHLSKGIALHNVRNAFVRSVSGKRLYDNLVRVFHSCRFVTVQDCFQVGIPKSIMKNTGYYSGGGFPVDGQSVLVQRCFARHVRHYGYVIGGKVAGPIVILDSDGQDSNGFAETHHRWSPGVLFDRMGHVSPTSLGIWNRGGMGSGHGWTTSNSVLWNCVANKEGFGVESPPIGRNWGVGGFIYKFQKKWYNQETKNLYNVGSFVGPSSLYLQQLQDRLGGEALANVAEHWQIVGRPVSPVVEIGTPNRYGDAVVTINGIAGFNSIRYTTDGSNPTRKSNVYQKPFRIRLKAGTTVKAISLDDGPYPSRVSVTSHW